MSVKSYDRGGSSQSSPPRTASQAAPPLPKDPPSTNRPARSATRVRAVIVERNGAQCFLETDFMVTDLFPEEVTEGKHVLFIYLDPVKDEYMALKAEKEALIAEGKYEGEDRKEIARKMGRLLSYPEERIESMLSR